jgi:hypothetical protein
MKMGERRSKKRTQALAETLLVHPARGQCPFCLADGPMSRKLSGSAKEQAGNTLSARNTALARDKEALSPRKFRVSCQK